ncbi:MAG: alpha/beta hydrolase [Deltaproteobacteria bacterium]|nr:alpha/beta hydrolase [Deltaproteobacteria bacterium]
MYRIDPRVFDPANIDFETAELNSKIEKELSALPPIYTFRPQDLRTARSVGNSIWGPIRHVAEAQNRMITGPAGKIPLRVFVPDKVKAVYLHMHGGGFMLGQADHFDEALSTIAQRCHVAVVSVDYRLAPENPHPAGPDDCEAAAIWLVENSLGEFGSQKLIIGGESAGANLSAVTLLRMRDRHGFTDFSGAVLTYGAYDLSMTPSARNWGERNLILTTNLMRWFHENYVPTANYTDPDISPLYADLSGMPPAFFTVGTLDPLIDDSLFMHLRWLAAGNPSELAIYPGGVHAFDAFPIELARKANARIREFINELANDE